MRKIYALLRIISFCLIAFFLMLVLDQDTLTTALQRFFIFSYFLIMIAILYHFLFLRYCIQDKKIIFYTLIAAFILSCGLGKKYLPQKDVESIVRIEVQNKKNDKSQGFEVWIGGIKKNDNTIDIKDYITNYSNYENRDSSIFMLGEQQTEFIDLRLSSVYQYKLVVGQHAWSGIINIYLDNHLYKQYDLYSKDAKEMDIILPVNKAEWSMSYFIILILGRYFLIFYSIIYLLSYMIQKKNSKSIKILSLYIFILSYFLKYNINFATVFFPFLLSFILWNYIFKYQSQNHIKGYLKKIPMGLFLINIYITFSFVGASIFLQIHKVELYLNDFILFFIWNIIVLPYSYIFVIVTEKYMNKNSIRKIEIEEENKHKHYLSLYFIPLVIMGMMLYILNPGLMTPDSFDQYAQAHGLAKFHDHHPIFHTFIEMILYRIYDSPMTIAISQILFFSFVCGQIGNYFIKKGYKKSMIVILLFFFCVLPTNLINIITLWKDIPFSIGILYMSYLLVRISSEKNRFFTVFNSIALGLDLILIAFVRHNGIMISFISILYIVSVLVKRKKYFQIIIPGIYVVVIMLIKIGLPIYLNATPNGNVITVVPLHGIAYVNYEKGLEDKQTVQLLESYMPLEQWVELYTPSSANPYMYSEEASKFNTLKKYRKTEIKPVLEAYIRTFIKQPYLIVKDRLYGTDLLWNINQAEYAYNYRYASLFWKEKQEYDMYHVEHKHNSFEKRLLDYIEVSYEYKILDNILWRVGIYLDIILLLIYILLKNKMYHKLIAFMPIILNTAVLFIAMAWQDYRYVYYIFMSFGFLYLFTINNRTMEKNRL